MGVILTLMMMTLTGNYWPEKLDLKTTKVYCSDIIALNMKDGYKYIGIRALHRDYMTDYTDADKLQAEINKQCRNKNEKRN
jgi:hypothetical protein